MVSNTLNEVTPQGFAGQGIFNALRGFAVPWADVPEIFPMLDAEYYGNISGDKITSPAVDKLLSQDGTLSTNALDTLAGIIWNVFAPNWDKLWKTLSLEYDPIQNYSMTEEMVNDDTLITYGKSHSRTDNLTHSRQDNLTTQRTDNLTHAKTGTDTETPNVTVDVSDRVNGFNSTAESGVPSNNRKQVSTGDSKTTYGSSETDTGTQTQTDSGTQTMTDSGTVTDADSGTDRHEHSYTLTRKGNIGVTTSQQMIQSERDLWVWNFFLSVVFPDIDRVLTIQVY